MNSDLTLIPNDIVASTSLFVRSKEKLIELLHNFTITIEHVGSTAIPNTIGKGIIDVIVACQNEQDQELIKQLLITAGYRQGELQKKADGRLFFTNSQGKTKAGDMHLHVVITNSSNYTTVLAFKDYLLANPDEVENYNKEKLRLAKVTKHVRENYTKQKEPYIKKILTRALSKS